MYEGKEIDISQEELQKSNEIITKVVAYYSGKPW